MDQATTCLYLIVFLLCGQSRGIEECKRKSDCSCESEKGLIDLSSLSTSKVPPSLKAEDGGDTYYFNPCKDFTLGGKSGAIIEKSNVNTFLGSNKDAKLSVDDNGQLELELSLIPPFLTASIVRASILYVFKHDTRERNAVRVSFIHVVPRSTTKVTIVCGQATTFTLTSEYPPTNFLFELIAPQGCPGYKPPNKSDGGGLSTGSIMLIVFFVLLFCYCAFGVAFKTFVRKAEGADRVPNVSLWAALPSLIKDGFRFTVTCGKS